jgi:hypothetical protein
MADDDIYEQVEAETAKGVYDRAVAAYQAGDMQQALELGLQLQDMDGCSENGRYSAWFFIGKGYLAAGDYTNALAYLSAYLNTPLGHRTNREANLEAFLAAYNGEQRQFDGEHIYD